MAYAVGIALAVIVVCFGRATGIDRDRAFYPILTITIASYYVLFAAMAGPRQTFDLGTAGLLALLLARSNLAVARPCRAIDRATDYSSWQCFGGDR